LPDNKIIRSMNSYSLSAGSCDRAGSLQARQLRAKKCVRPPTLSGRCGTLRLSRLRPGLFSCASLALHLCYCSSLMNMATAMESYVYECFVCICEIVWGKEDLIIGWGWMVSSIMFRHKWSCSVFLWETTKLPLPLPLLCWNMFILLFNQFLYFSNYLFLWCNCRCRESMDCCLWWASMGICTCATWRRPCVCAARESQSTSSSPPPSTQTHREFWESPEPDRYTMDSA
jgi:hypothetical protein